MANLTTISADPGCPEPGLVRSLTPIVFAGADEDAAAAAMAPLRTIHGITSAIIEPRAYVDALEEGPPHPEPDADGAMPLIPVLVDQNGFVPELTDAIIDELVTMQTALGGAVLMLRYVRGALSRVEPDATAFAHRDSEVLH